MEKAAAHGEPPVLFAAPVPEARVGVSDILLEEPAGAAGAVASDGPATQPNGDAPGVKPRRPWLAIAATLLSPLLGYIYAGAPLRGLLVVTAARATMWIALFLSLDASGPATFLPWIALVLATATAVLADVWYTCSGRRHYVLRNYNRWYVYVAAAIPLLMLDAALNAAMRSTVHAFKVPSASMQPTLEPGDHLLVDKTAYWNEDPQRFDVVVFSAPGDKLFIKRVIGLPGETVEIRDREVFIDGKPLREPHVKAPAESAELAPPHEKRDTMPAMVVPEKEYFVLGDARDRSHDSRFTGTVAREAIEGRVKVLYFSWSDASPLIRWERIGMPVR
jgi:signal peptidase I